MIRFVLRSLGVVLLALAFIFVIYDGMKSIADGRIYLTRIGQFWADVHTLSFKTFEDGARGLPLGLWSVIVQPLLEQPASAVFAILSVLLMLAGRKKRALIGYARN